MNRHLSAFLLSSFFCTLSFAQDTIRLANTTVERDFVVTAGHFRTAGQKFLTTGRSYMADGAFSEFSFRVDGKIVGTEAFIYRSMTDTMVDASTRMLRVSLAGTEGAGSAGIAVELRYWLYDTLPVVRKQVVVRNLRNTRVSLTDLDIEHIPITVSGTATSEIYRNYGTSLERMPYKGDYNDAAMLIWNNEKNEGIIVGNEAFSVMKRTEIYTHGFPILQLGLAASTDTYPFAKWLRKGEVFESPCTFLCFAKAPTWQEAFEGSYQTFLAEHLGLRYFSGAKKPFSFYNTWRPFRMGVSDSLMRKVADGLSGTGLDVLTLDCGWYDMMGSYEADRKKFPNGLEPVFDYIRSKGMQGGLWMSFATVNKKSAVARDHPDWLLHDANGKPYQAHMVDNDVLGEDVYTMSMGSPWYDFILKKMSDVIRRLQLVYVKLDLSVGLGAYQPDPRITGDYHPARSKTYTDRASGYWEMFAGTQRLCDDLHRAFPNLLIDCTYETFGRHNGVDFGLLQHAEYDWVTNYELPAPIGPLSIRQMRWERARTMPVSPLLIGNQLMQTKDSAIREFTFLSLAPATVVLVGDVRNLSQETRDWYLRRMTWFKAMEEKYAYTKYYQSGTCFDAPTRGSWDGCYRFNPSKEGGLLFFYRNASFDGTRTFPLPFLKPDARYRVSDPFGVTGTREASGRELLERGLQINLPSTWSATVLEIEKIGR